jgi:mRNA-degrading endonuclease RelE of RelBE toxin-antitoxin system
MSFDVSTLPNFDRELKRLAKKYPSIKTDLLVGGKPDK